MSCKFIQKSKILISAIAFSILLQSSGALEAVPPQPDFDVSRIQEELLHPSIVGPIYEPIYKSNSPKDDLRTVITAKETLLNQLKKIASVDENGHLRSGVRIPEDKQSTFLELSQQYGSLCIDLKYAQKMKSLQEEDLSDRGQITQLLSDGPQYLRHLKALVETLPDMYALKGTGYQVEQWNMQYYTVTPDDNFMVLIGGKRQGNAVFSLELLKEEMKALEANPNLHNPAGDPQYKRSPKVLLEQVLYILGDSSFEAAQKTLDNMAVWMSAFKDFTETTRDELKTLKSEKKKLLKDNTAFMKKLEVFKKGERLESVDGEMTPYFTYFGLIPTSTEFLKVEPANISAVESLMKETFVTKVSTLETEISSKAEDLDLFGKVERYILDIEEYLSKSGKMS